MEDVDTRSVEHLLRRWNGDSKVSVLSKSGDEKHEPAGFDLHLSKISATSWDVCVLSHALLVRLENAGDAFKAIMKRVVLAVATCNMCDRETCCAFIQNEFSSINDIRQLRQQCLDGACVWNEEVYDLRPGFVQALVPDARGKELDCVAEALASISNIVRALVIHSFAKTCLHQVHLVDKTEDLCSRTALVESTYNVRVGDNVGLKFARLNVEDENKNSY